MSLLLAIILIVLLFGGGGFAGYRGGYYGTTGYGGISLVGLLLAVLVVWMLAGGV